MVQRLLALAGLARIVDRQVPAAHQLAEGDDGQHHRQPAEHGDLAVPGAPSGDPLDHRRAGPWASVAEPATGGTFTFGQY